MKALSVPVNHEHRISNVITRRQQVTRLTALQHMQTRAAAYGHVFKPTARSGEEGLRVRKALGTVCVCGVFMICCFKDAVSGSGCIASRDTDLAVIGPRGFGKNKS